MLMLSRDYIVILAHSSSHPVPTMHALLLLQQQQQMQVYFSVGNDGQILCESQEHPSAPRFRRIVREHYLETMYREGGWSKSDYITDDINASKDAGAGAGAGARASASAITAADASGARQIDLVKVSNSRTAAVTAATASTNAAYAKGGIGDNSIVVAGDYLNKNEEGSRQAERAEEGDGEEVEIAESLEGLEGENDDDDEDDEAEEETNYNDGSHSSASANLRTNRAASSSKPFKLVHRGYRNKHLDQRGAREPSQRRTAVSKRLYPKRTSKSRPSSASVTISRHRQSPPNLGKSAQNAKGLRPSSAHARFGSGGDWEESKKVGGKFDVAKAVAMGLGLGYNEDAEGDILPGEETEGQRQNNRRRQKEESKRHKRLVSQTGPLSGKKNNLKVRANAARQSKDGRRDSALRIGRGFVAKKKFAVFRAAPAVSSISSMPGGTAVGISGRRVNKLAASGGGDIVIL